MSTTSVDPTPVPGAVARPGLEMSRVDLRAALAAATALGLGALAAVMMVAGHQPWDGPQVASVSQTHGLHLGDVLSVVPLAVSLALARWCLRRPTA